MVLRPEPTGAATPRTREAISAMLPVDSLYDDRKYREDPFTRWRISVFYEKTFSFKFGYVMSICTACLASYPSNASHADENDRTSQ
jgi:hypothetical protein